LRISARELLTSGGGASLYQVQQLAVRNIKNATSIADVFKHFLELSPQTKLLNFPGMPVQMPHSTVAQNAIKPGLTELKPILESNQIWNGLQQRPYCSQPNQIADVVGPAVWKRLDGSWNRKPMKSVVRRKHLRAASSPVASIPDGTDNLRVEAAFGITEHGYFRSQYLLQNFLAFADLARKVQGAKAGQNRV
jgi:hypothetical protein